MTMDEEVQAYVERMEPATRALFDRLHEQGNTIVLVTHEHDIAMHAHRIIHIRDGKVERDEPIAH